MRMSSHGKKGHNDGKIAGLYDLEETIGRGHFAVVKLARHVFTGEKVAVKVIDKTKLDEISKAHLFQEVRCMKLVQHPHVVRLYEVIDTQTKLYLILELGDGGDMYDYIMKHEQGLSEDVARKYFRQIVQAISYCHRLHVVHRDLKPENVVFFKKLGIVKLTDFGFSNQFKPGRQLETSCGSLAYSAPEILLGDSYDAPAVDVWSLGVILFMLVCGEAPFHEANDSETLTMILDCKFKLPSHLSSDCKNLISVLLKKEPHERHTLDDILAHPWLRLTESPSAGSQAAPAKPLLSRSSLTEDDHCHIIQQMVNGKIASKDEIMRALERNAYNHITATYYLLAERKLKRLQDRRQSGHHLHSSSAEYKPDILSIDSKPKLASLALSPRNPNTSLVDSCDSYSPTRVMNKPSLEVTSLVSPPSTHPSSLSAQRHSSTAAPFADSGFCDNSTLSSCGNDASSAGESSGGSRSARVGLPDTRRRFPASRYTRFAVTASASSLAEEDEGEEPEVESPSPLSPSFCSPRRTSSLKENMGGASGSELSISRSAPSRRTMPAAVGVGAAAGGGGAPVKPPGALTAEAFVTPSANGVTGAARPFHVRSSPQILLNQIHEEEGETEDEDDVPSLPAPTSRHHVTGAGGAETTRKRRSAGAGRPLSRGASCSSSDASDTDDTDNKKRKDKLKDKLRARGASLTTTTAAAATCSATAATTQHCTRHRDNSDQSSDTDGGSSNRRAAGGSTARHSDNTNNNRRRNNSSNNNNNQESKENHGGGGGGGEGKKKQETGLLSADNASINQQLEIGEKRMQTTRAYKVDSDSSLCDLARKLTSFCGVAGGTAGASVAMGSEINKLSYLSRSNKYLADLSLPTNAPWRNFYNHSFNEIEAMNLENRYHSQPIYVRSKNFADLIDKFRVCKGLQDNPNADNSKGDSRSKVKKKYYSHKDRYKMDSNTNGFIPLHSNSGALAQTV